MVAVRVSPRCAIPLIEGEVAPKLGRFRIDSVLAVKIEAKPAPALLARTVKVTLANMYLPAIESVGSRVEAVCEEITEQSAGKVVGTIAWFCAQWYQTYVKSPAVAVGSLVQVPVFTASGVAAPTTGLPVTVAGALLVGLSVTSVTAVEAFSTVPKSLTAVTASAR